MSSTLSVTTSVRSLSDVARSDMPCAFSSIASERSLMLPSVSGCCFSRVSSRSVCEIKSESNSRFISCWFSNPSSLPLAGEAPETLMSRVVKFCAVSFIAAMSSSFCVTRTSSPSISCVFFSTSSLKSNTSLLASSSLFHVCTVSTSFALMIASARVTVRPSAAMV